MERATSAPLLPINLYEATKWLFWTTSRPGTGGSASRRPFVLGDLAYAAGLERLFSQHSFDAVMHFAQTHWSGSRWSNPFLPATTSPTPRICCALHPIRSAPVRALLDGQSLRPARVYQSQRMSVSSGTLRESKYLIERMLPWLDRVLGLRYACLRYFNAAGALPNGMRGEDHTPEHHLIPRVLQVALGQRRSVEIYGVDYPTPDGTCVRDYVHVVDLAQAHILALDALDGGSRVYNLGNGRGFSVRQVVEMARDVTGHSIPTVEGPRRPGDPAVLIADSTRIRRELGWKPRHSDLRDIIDCVGLAPRTPSGTDRPPRWPTLGSRH